MVIDGGDLDPSTQTLWGEIERQLDGQVEKMSGMVAPGGGSILKLLDRPKPVLILIDEIADYLDGSKVSHDQTEEGRVRSRAWATPTWRFRP